MGGKTGRPRKHPQPNGLKDGIYWRPSSNDPSIGSFSVAFKNPMTKKWTTRVVLRDIPKADIRKKSTIDRVNELAHVEVAKHAPRSLAAIQEVLFKDAWTDFLKNKKNRRNQRLRPSTRQDYASIYDVYFRGAFTAPPRPSQKPQKRQPPSRMTPEELAANERQRAQERQHGYSLLSPEEILDLKKNDPALLEEMRKRELAGLAGFTLAELAEEWADEQFPLGASRLKRWEAWLDTRAYQGDGVEPDKKERAELNIISLKRKANILVVMKSFLSYCHKKGWTSENLGRSIEIPAPDTTTLRKPPKYEKLMELLEALEQYGQVNRVFAELALYSGLRAGELVALDWESIHFDEEFILVERSYSHGVLSETTKGLKSRIVPLHDRITSLLQQWQTICPSKTMVFPATRLAKEDPDSREKGNLVRIAKTGQRMSVDTFRQKIWNKATAEVGLDGLRIHDLRHVYITWLASLNVNSLLIQKAAGHQDPRTTAAYLDLDPRIYKSIRDAFNQPHTSLSKAPARTLPADEGKIDFSWAQEPARKPVERPEQPEHRPGSGPVIKRKASRNKPLSGG